MIRIAIYFIAAVCLFGANTRTSSAADYPTGPIKVIVPYPPGGLVDIVMRVVSEKMSSELGKAVIVESRIGAGGTIAGQFVARSEPDGYTLLAITDSHATNPLAFKKLPYDSVADFAPIGLIGNSPLLLTIHKSVAAKSANDFIELAKKRADKPFSYGSIGFGSAAHLAGELFRARAGGIPLLHVPFKGGAPAVNDLIAGHIDSMFLSPIVSLPHIESGAIHPLGLAATTRFPLLPNVPTMAEIGYPMEAGYWVGLVSPAKTPPEIVALLERTLFKVLQEDAVRKRLTEIGLLVTPKNSSDFGRYIVEQMRFWKEFTSQNNIQFN